MTTIAHAISCSSRGPQSPAETRAAKVLELVSVLVRTGEMEKYFVAQLEELDQRRSRSKLVEVVFSRRPSTFGVLYVTQSRACPSREWWLKLATLSLTPDNKAKFMIVREIQLNHQDDIKSSTLKRQAQFSSIVDFDTMPSGQLLIEGASSSSAKQALHSSVFLLSGDGHLLVASTIGRTSSQVTDGSLVEHGAKLHRRETFVQIKTAEQCATDLSRDNSAQVHVNLFLLSLSSWYSYTLTLRNSSTTKPQANSDLQLVHKYSLAHQSIDSAAQFVRMLPLAPDPNGHVVLLELSDGSVQVVRQNQCLARLPGLCQDVAQSLLLLAPPSVGSRREPDLLISVTHSNQLVANSLIVRREFDQLETSNPTRTASEPGDDQEENIFEPATMKDRTRTEEDPDGLLVEEPTFELEHCWTLNLNEFRGVQTMFDDDDDDYEDEGDLERDDRKRARRRAGPGFCLPMGASSSGGLDSRAEGQPSSWPRFLLVFCQRHLLVFSFEQANVLPFSIVYDRAFLNLTNSMSPLDDDLDGDKKQAKQQTPEADKRVDLRLKPKLLHNVKLVGTRTSDNLFNMLMLSPRLRLIQACSFKQLALLAAVSNQGHVLAFKLISKKILGPNHKDNLYQQLLADSLRDSALLQDELHRLRQIEDNLRMLIDKLETKSGANEQGDGPTRSMSLQQRAQSAGDSLQFTVDLEPNQSGTSCNLYNLIISWQSVIMKVDKVVVVSLVEGSQLRTVSDECSDSMFERVKIKRISLENDEQNKIQEAIPGETPTIAASTRNCATIELDHDDDQLNVLSDNQDEANCLEFPESISRRNQLVVSMSLDDLKVGTVRVYLVCSANFDVQKHKHHHLPPEQTHPVTQSNLGRRYIKRELKIKLLNSFRFIQPEERSTSSQFQDQRLAFGGAFGFERALAWLGRLVDLPNDVIKMRGKEGILLEFSAISRKSRIRVEISGEKMTFNGNAPKAMEMIKQHILKEATNNSIQLEIQTN